MKTKLIQGFIFGIIFGFLLQKSNVTYYDVIMNQLLLRDFTVMKVMLSAIVVGMWGIAFLNKRGLVGLNIKPYAFGSTVIGGLIFGVGLAILGYCPGTVTGAAGQGSLDALFGGLGGVLFGSWIFSLLFPALENNVLKKGSLGKKRLPELIKANEWVVIAALTILIIGIFVFLENKGL